MTSSPDTRATGQQHSDTEQVLEYEQKLRGDGVPIPNEYDIYYIDDDGEAVHVADVYSEKFAASIVRAVNAHEDLTEALERARARFAAILSWTDQNTPTRDAALHGQQIIDAALAKLNEAKP